MKGKFRTLVRFLLFAVALPLGLFAFALWVHDMPLPQSLTRRICASLSTPELLVRCDGVSFGFRRGLTVRGARAYLREKATTAPVVRAEEVNAALALHRFPWRAERLIRRLRVTRLAYRRLPDSYYIPASVANPGQPDYQEVDRPVELKLPPLRPFKLQLVEPDILGIRPSLVEAAAVSSGPHGLKVKGVTLDWPDTDEPQHLAGEAELDLDRQTVTGQVSGRARQWHIRPLLEALDIPVSLEYMDAFTEVRAPVPAAYRFSVNLRNNDFHMSLDLNPKGGLYNGVPFSEAHGTIEIDTQIRGTNFNSRVKIGPIVADFLPDGHAEGTVTYQSTNGVRRLFLAANSTRLPLPDAFKVADVFTDGSLDGLQLETAPTLVLDGVLAVDDADAAANDLKGSFYFGRGNFFGVPFREVNIAFRQLGTSVTYPNFTASMRAGGSITGSARIDFPDFDREKASFEVSCAGRGLALGDIAEALKVDAADRRGTVDFDATISGPFATNLASRLNGRGRLACRDGQISRTRLFMGFTDYLSQNVPGVSSVVDMTQGSASFEIKDGVITSKDLAIEGNVFALHADGKYDIARDAVEARARVQFFKKESLLGKLTQPITDMLMKTLLEFRVYGTLEEPKWQYSTSVTRLGGGK